MLSFNELIELREKLYNGLISLKSAKELFWKDFNEERRSWHTKDWKERRSKIIKEKCEICNSRETLTIQHLSHPKKYYDYENEVTRKYLNLSIGNNNVIEEKEFLDHMLTHYNYFPVPLCPKCESRKPNDRIRKLPKYLCTQCQHEFDEPKYKTIQELITNFYNGEDSIENRDKCFVSNDKWKNNNSLKQAKYWIQREKAKTKYFETIEREAFLKYLDDNIKYVSFADTITTCKKCASYFDLYKMELCPKCGENYKGIEHSTCIQCLPEEKQKLALEKIASSMQFREMEKQLGVD